MNTFNEGFKALENRIDTKSVKYQLYIQLGWKDGFELKKTEWRAEDLYEEAKAYRATGYNVKIIRVEHKEFEILDWAKEI